MIEKTRKNRRGIQVSTATASLAAALATAQREKARADKAEAERAVLRGQLDQMTVKAVEWQNEYRKLRKVAEAARNLDEAIGGILTWGMGMAFANNHDVHWISRIDAAEERKAELLAALAAAGKGAE